RTDSSAHHEAPGGEDMSGSASLAPEIAVFDPQTYGHGDPTTFGLPLEQFAYLREHAPVYRQEFEQPFLMDSAWVLSRHADIEMVDRDPQTFAFNRGWFNCSYGTFAFVDPIKNPEGKPNLLASDG